MIVEKTHIPRTLIIFIDVESLRTGQELENIYGEFYELVNSAGAEIVQSSSSKQKSPSVSHFINKGKLEEILDIVDKSKAELVIVNHQLSASQARNLELKLKVRVIDKTELILDIFASRATTHIGKLQVELAQLNHLSTRLIRGWTHLERQKGGIGLRGPGETQLETDRRLIGHRIKRLKSRLDKAHKQKQLNSYSRKKSRNKLVALVGYTNAGKTTLFNSLTNSKQLAEDKLFATLDSVTRKNIDPELGPILFSDTVGFISELPTQLIESFKATLDELKSADLLLHVVDISDIDHRQKEKEVNQILDELNLQSIPQIRVNNKCDIKGSTNFDSKNKDNEVWISAEKNIGIQELRELINNDLFNGIYRGWISLEASLGKIRAKLFRMGCIDEEKVSPTGKIFAHIHIGQDELDNFIHINGFALCNDKDILLETQST
ncbi:GTPase HflX [Gammaproteobacteria bacterium]|jgi:GTP-binding protein HflX|nr:GTPase HflX [Gammaproteobacteria bacterium]MDA7821584.1 GTPase HflX [Gammaproteobacteria bacterium]MDA7857313.1 GTPase HflX [Gammaproteobacteria bacterium]MDA8673950.1 GTPase HflX [Gammaproteobacteria bacterium]MDA8683889.1 GTPase HflX [Gammaproteobacteria bacterium]|tara:strand:+ start:538 stop:1845 length:1308 start_codon:yes stop_codon:yes gene_type:complete